MSKIKHNSSLGSKVADSHRLVNYLLSGSLIVIDTPRYRLFSVTIVRITLFSRIVKVVKWTA